MKKGEIEMGDEAKIVVFEYEDPTRTMIMILDRSGDAKILLDPSQVRDLKEML